MTNNGAKSFDLFKTEAHEQHLRDITTCAEVLTRKIEPIWREDQKTYEVFVTGSWEWNASRQAYRHFATSKGQHDICQQFFDKGWKTVRCERIASTKGFFPFFLPKATYMFTISMEEDCPYRT